MGVLRKDIAERATSSSKEVAHPRLEMPSMFDFVWLVLGGGIDLGSF